MYAMFVQHTNVLYLSLATRCPDFVHLQKARFDIAHQVQRIARQPLRWVQNHITQNIFSYMSWIVCVFASVASYI